MLDDRDLRRELDRLEARLAGLRLALGERDASEPLPAADFDVLVCRVGDEFVCFALDDVVEVVQMAMLVEIPEADAWVVGLLDLGGDAIPTLDVGARMSQGPRAPSVDDLILICASGSGRCGLVVQAVLGVERVSPRRFEDREVRVARASYIRGVWCAERGPTALLSVRRLIGLYTREVGEDGAGAGAGQAEARS